MDERPPAPGAVVARRRVQLRRFYAADRTSHTLRSSHPCHTNHVPDLDAPADRYPDALCHADQSSHPNSRTVHRHAASSDRFPHP